MVSKARTDSHVDVIRNDYGRAKHLRVATVSIDDDALQVVPTEPGEAGDRCVEIVWEVLRRGGGDDAQRLNRLHETLHGDYLFATEPHSDADCPFANDEMVEMPAVAVTNDQLAGHRA